MYYLNTKDNKIQWHPAFEASLQIELEKEADSLEFEAEHLLSKKPLQIDVVVIKKEKGILIQKNIGKIFRQYNIVEYKSPDDTLSIDDFYKVYGYACLYKAESETINKISASELTITFVCYKYPKAMLKRLWKERGIICEKAENGIFYLKGDAIPIQLILISELSKEKNYWLSHLRKNLKSGGEIREFIERYEKKKDLKLYQALADTIMRANRKEMEEEKKMCEALRELFADELEQSRTEGIKEGIKEGIMEGRVGLIIKKFQKGWTVEQTADMLEETPEFVSQVYHILSNMKQDYDVREVFKRIYGH